jgi:hypothetical protein
LRRDAFLIKRLWLRVRRHGKNRWVNRQAVWWGNPTTGFWKRGSRTSSCVFASISFIVKLKVGPTNSSSRIIITELLLVEDARNPPISGPNALRWTAMPLVPVVVLLPSDSGHPANRQRNTKNRMCKPGLSKRTVLAHVVVLRRERRFRGNSELHWLVPQEATFTGRLFLTPSLFYEGRGVFGGCK